MRLPIPLPRVTLRRMSPKDLAAFQSYRQNPNVARFQTWEQMNDTAALQFLAAVETAPLFAPGDWMQIGIDRDGVLAGDLGLCRTGDGVELGITLAPDAQGQGLGSEAWRGAMALVWARTDAGRILGITDLRNTPSIRLMQAAGLSETGRQTAIHDGEACIDVTFQIRRPASATMQWSSRRPR